MSKTMNVASSLFTNQSFDFLKTLSPQMAVPATPDQADIPYFFFLPVIHSLNTILTRPSKIFIEMGKRGTLDREIRKISAGSPDFGLSLTTVNSYHSVLPDIVSIALQNRFGFHMPHRQRIRTCLQEALTNAVVHGNIGIHSGICSWADMQAQQEAIATCIKQEDIAQRRVGIAAWNREDRIIVTVHDDGKGIATDMLERPLPAPSSKTGRGLFIIRSLTDGTWIDPDTMSLCMTFTY